MNSQRLWNLALIIGASGIRGVGQWLFVFLLIRVNGPESVGVYGLATAIVTPISALTSLQLPRVIATEKPGERELGSYLTVRLLATALNAILLVPLVVIVSVDEFWPIVALMFLTAVLAFIDIFSASLLQHSRIRQYGAMNCIVQSITWFGAALTLLISHDLAMALALPGVAVLTTFWFVRVAFPNSELLYARPLMSGVGSIVIENLPLGLALLVDSLVSHSPRFLLERTHGAFDLGILVGLLTFLSASTLISESIGQAVTPMFTRVVHANIREPLSRVVKTIWVTTSVLVILVPVIGWWAGPRIAAILLDPVYADYPAALAGIGVISVLQFSNRVTTIILNASKTLGRLFGVNVVTLIVVLGVGMWAIPRFGVNGAVVALVSGNAVRALAIQWMVWQVESRMSVRGT